MDQRKDEELKFDLKAVFEPEDYLYFYGDRLNEERTNKEVEFLVKELELSKPMRILDLACGHGRHSNRLAELGHKVTGVDITPGFLAMAKEDAKKRGIKVRYIRKDVRKISFKEEFDRVIMMFTSFGYFTDEENFKVLKNIASALKRNGLFCFDTLNRDGLMKAFQPCIIFEKGNDLMVDRNSFDTITGRLYNRRVVIRNGERKDKPFFVRVYNPTEIRDLLRRAGLMVTKFCSDWEGNPLTSDSRRMILIARK